MRTIKDIIDYIGADNLAEATNRRTAPTKSWPYNGIPEELWPQVMALDPTLTADDLHAANQHARQMSRE